MTLGTPPQLNLFLKIDLPGLTLIYILKSCFDCSFHNTSFECIICISLFILMHYSHDGSSECTIHFMKVKQHRRACERQYRKSGSDEDMKRYRDATRAANRSIIDSSRAHSRARLIDAAGDQKLIWNIANEPCTVTTATTVTLWTLVRKRISAPASKTSSLVSCVGSDRTSPPGCPPSVGHSSIFHSSTCQGFTNFNRFRHTRCSESSLP